LRYLAVILGAILVSTGAGGAQETPAGPLALLPDTSDRIVPFADQLREVTSDKLVRFVATHFAGTQKMRRWENARYRAVNPRWMLLHYRLGVSSGPVPYIHNGEWGSDWREVTRHEDWFLRNANGARHHHRTNNWDIHDIRHAGFREYWVGSTIADMRATDAQGVFADSFEAGVSGHGVTPPDPRFSGTAPANPAAWENGVTWQQQKLDFADYIADRFAETPEKFLFVPNIGALTTSWWWPGYARVDGAMLENFALQATTVEDWLLSMNRALELTRAGKLVIVESYPSTVRDRLFLLASYLLIKGQRTFINGGGLGVFYYPEYTIDLGPPLDALPETAQSYLWQGVYKREFHNGVVLVNPGNVDALVALPHAFAHATSIGGGATDDSHIDRLGNYIGGRLEYQRVTTLQLPPRSGALLKRMP